MASHIRPIDSFSCLSVFIPLSTRPVGVCIYGVPYNSMFRLLQISQFSSCKGCASICSDCGIPLW